MNGANIFVCLNCGKQVNDSPIGSKQRNHCPFCLWSLHLDEELPGDRKSNCHGLMQPVGLTTKSGPIVHVARHPTGVVARHLRKDEIGELMIVHQCQKCNMFSKNRVAGDDNPERLIELLAPEMHESPWKLFTESDKDMIAVQLFGKR